CSCLHARGEGERERDWDGGDTIGVGDAQPPLRLLWLVGSSVHERKRVGDPSCFPPSCTKAAAAAAAAPSCGRP
ncbi:unnamed protein product, partial [Urochloa humidicola]